MRTPRPAGLLIVAALAVAVVAGCNDNKKTTATDLPDETTSAAPSSGPTSSQPSLAPTTTATAAASPTATRTSVRATPTATASRTLAPTPRRTSARPVATTARPTPVRTSASPKPVMTTQPPSTGTRALTIAGYAFTPKTFSISRGTTVRVTNQDSATHTWTSTSGVWDSGALNQGQSYSYRFMTKGTFNFMCEPHPFMTGSVTVT
jgi:plastocyanin